MNIYKDILCELIKSANNFEGAFTDDILELKEDFAEILKMIDITKHQSNIDGIMKSTPQLLEELKDSNLTSDKQICIESIMMIRGSMMDIESALSNATDSMQKLVVSIRDA